VLKYKHLDDVLVQNNARVLARAQRLQLQRVPGMMMNGQVPRLLLVDDDKNASPLKDLLERNCAFEVTLASDLQQAEAALAEATYSAALLSLTLSSTTGLGALAVLQAIAPELPVLVLVDADQETHALKAVHQGAADYLIRNQIYPTLLGRSIRHAIEYRQAQDLRQVAEFALKRERDFTSAVIETSGALIAVFDRNGRIVRFNRSCERITGYAASDVIGRELWDLLLEAEVAPARAAFGELTAGGSPNQLENHWVARNGSLHRIAWAHTPLMDTRGEIEFVVGTGIEVTERRRAEEAVRRSESKYRALFEQSRDAIYMTDRDGTILEANGAMRDLLGLPATDLTGANVESFYADPADRAVFQREFLLKRSISDLEVRLRRSDGLVLWCLLSISPRQLPDGNLIGFQGIIHDISDRKRAEQRLVHNAYHDVLTGLPNRALFLDRLERALTRWHRDQAQLFAVLFLDLDRFKVVNDSLGHSAGDELLVAIAGVIGRCIRDEDTVARLGGDEFAVLLNHVEGDTDAALVAERLHSCLEQPIRVGGQNVFVSSSAGIALPQAEHEKAEDMLRNADIAMYRAKSEGPSRHAIYHPNMHSAAVNILELDMDLRVALQEQQFVLHYQPIYTLGNGHLSGFEALLRWNHPRRGLLPPADFLQRAEDTGLIVQIGRWVMREVCAQLGAWNRICGRQRLPFISFNVSSRQLAQADLVGEIAAAIREHNVPRDRLMVELTETSLMQSPESCALTIRKLRELGVRFAIDDFGTGYSSLSYLHRLPISGLKIDRSFITRLEHDSDSSELVATIVSLAHSLGLDAVAEGVETETQFSNLQRLRPKYVQGFYLSFPLDVNAVSNMISTGP
jgi:diguanylate cyclase (GGDEF)-like protein/PAS domain S-box-containing protein